MRLFVLLAGLVLGAPAAAGPINVALGKPVTLVGAFGNSTVGTSIVWADPAPGPASLVTDGAFNPSQTNWQINSVWWHQYDTLPPRQIVVDLLGIHKLTGAIFQGDNNDVYLLEYQDAADVWHTLWNIPAIFTNGVETRPNPADNTEIFDFAAPVDAKAVRISGQDVQDSYFSVTELQVFAVPEPATAALLGAGLFAAGWFRRRGRN